VKRLLELLRHDECDDSVVCDCSLPVGNHLNAELDLSAAALCCADEPQPSPLRPTVQPTFDHVDCEQQVESSNGSDRSPPKSSSAVYRQYDATSGPCRTFKLPDVQVRLASPQQAELGDHVGRPPTSTATIVSSPDDINDPHYAVI